MTRVKDMQREIYENGPIVVSLEFWEDMISYGGGIYENQVGMLIGGHSMRVVGWGHDNWGHLYWICQNQWTSLWGLDGYINVKAGRIGIDNWALSCEPEL